MMGLTTEQLKKLREKTKSKPFEALQKEKADKIVAFLKSIPADKVFDTIEVAFDYDATGEKVEHNPYVLNIRPAKANEEGKKPVIARINISTKPQYIKNADGTFSYKKDEAGKVVYITQEQAALFWEKPVKEGSKLTKKHSILLSITKHPEVFVKHISAVPPKEKGKNEAKPVMFASSFEKFQKELRDLYVKEKEEVKIEPSFEDLAFDFED